MARLTAPLLIKNWDYVDEQGPKYRFYSFMMEAKHLVTLHRAFFAMLTSFFVATLAYGPWNAGGLTICVILAVIFSGRYAEYLLGGKSLFQTMDPTIYHILDVPFLLKQ